MPDDYEKRFLWIGKSVKMEIQSEPPSTLKVTRIETEDQLSGDERSRCLDWIQEAIETIRVEVGGDISTCDECGGPMTVVYEDPSGHIYCAKCAGAD